jgi:DNA-binding CsgD family transcriptional regulator
VRDEVAQLDLAHGRTLRRQDQRRRAGVLLERARDRFRHLAAEPFVTACDLQLSAIGRTASPRGPQQRLLLTPRELAVARRVARGHTNRETARALAVTEKTVAHHLGIIYSKLSDRARGTAPRRRVARFAALASVGSDRAPASTIALSVWFLRALTAEGRTALTSETG